MVKVSATNTVPAKEIDVNEAWEAATVSEWDNDDAFPVNDPVNHPSHYTYGNIEVIDFIEDKSLNFHRGNAVKYIARAGHKNDEIEDLKKAIWYLEREIKRLEKVF